MVARWVQNFIAEMHKVVHRSMSMYMYVYTDG